jgi:hypothetical protein
MRRDRILWLILAVSALLRFWKIDGDLPYVFHYDEPTLVDNAVWMWQNRTLDPHFLNYPTGLIYLLAALYGLMMFWGTVFGQFPNGQGAIAWLSAHTYRRPPEGGVLYFYPTIGVPALYLIGRVISAFAGVGAVAIVYAIARRAGGSVGLARVAALMLAISPLAVEHSHLITTDMTAAMLATACLLVSMQAEEGGRSRWAWAGLLGGLAAGVKYNAGLVVSALVLLAAWKWWVGRRRTAAGSVGHDAKHRPVAAAGFEQDAGRRPAAARSVEQDAGPRSSPVTRIDPGAADTRSVVLSLALAGAAAVIAFLLTTPFALLDISRFARDLGYEFHRVGSITASFRGAEAVEATPGEKLAGILWHNLGIFGIAVVLWGAIVAVRSRTYAKIAVVVWVAVALLPQLRWWSLYARYLLVAWPAILLLAAWGIEDLARRLAARATGLSRPHGLATAALAILVLAPGTVRLVTREARRAQPDPRVEMTEWIESNVPHGSRVVVEPGGAFPSTAHYTIDRVDFLGRATPDEYLARGIRFLGGSGRERLIEGKTPYRAVEENLARIRGGADVPWASGKYAIYFLRGEIGWQETAGMAIARGDLKGARTILEEAARSGAETPFLYKQLADVCMQDRDTTAAMQAYREAARRDTTDAEPLLALGDMALQRGDWEGSLRELRAAQRIAPRAPIVFHNLAVTYLYRARDRIRSGDRDGGRADWLLARENAATCAKTSPGDSVMVQTLEQVDRMGRRWGFTGGAR